MWWHLCITGGTDFHRTNLKHRQQGEKKRGLSSGIPTSGSDIPGALRVEPGVYVVSRSIVKVFAALSKYCTTRMYLCVCKHLLHSACGVADNTFLPDTDFWIARAEPRQSVLDSTILLCCMCRPSPLPLSLRASHPALKKWRGGLQEHIPP